jgi:hypothetical protein
MKEGTAPIRPQDINVPADALLLLPRNLAERFHVCPVALADMRGIRTLTVATANPNNLSALDQLQQLVGCRVVPVLANGCRLLHPTN